MKDQIVCSGALFYSKSTGRFLLLQKAQGKHAGTWGLVGGTNNEGESAWQGLQREISEEIGNQCFKQEPNLKEFFNCIKMCHYPHWFSLLPSDAAFGN